MSENRGTTTDPGDGQSTNTADLNANSNTNLSGEDNQQQQQRPTETQPSDNAPPADWRDRQIMRYKDRNAEIQRQLDAAQAELAVAKRQQPTTTQPATGPDEAEFNRRVGEEARKRASQQIFLDKCNEAQAAGRSQFQDFDAKVGDLLKLVDRNDPASANAYNNLVGAALETGEAPRLIHALGSDLNEAARLLAMNPTRMAVELTKKAAALDNGTTRGAQREQSGAPRPITTIGNRGVSHTAIDPADPDRSDQLSTAEFMRRREAQIRERGNNAA